MTGDGIAVVPLVETLHLLLGPLGAASRIGEDDALRATVHAQERSRIQQDPILSVHIGHGFPKNFGHSAEHRPAVESEGAGDDGVKFKASDPQHIE